MPANGDKPCQQNRDITQHRQCSSFICYPLVHTVGLYLKEGFQTLKICTIIHICWANPLEVHITLICLAHSYFRKILPEIQGSPKGLTLFRLYLDLNMSSRGTITQA